MVCCCIYSALNVTLCVSSTMSRPKSKRKVALAIANALANITHLFKNYLYPESDQARCLTAGITLSVFCGLCAFKSLV
ncbi:hypothetical protein EJ05DRAFT_69731 [Pseudovirgaria hyperparasitica]|uniref:Uncharacterized protein n=1 Tax=Pseudovirgaria hyperparasitica TaxID=470096 RepID=A0A6A6W4V1_9PEZI|nr:uncharacterized protein EJ05DRAFT_69731 [Pseudovirgaria hyperparasitica]KAF2756587.1 hypothetical protein EJ05DRAFT_69731 [Pseudovirgaria hyperparasitica]